jgi:phospholipid-translocating ATPase
MNRYFLIIACLQLVAIITPVNPLTTWLPLAVIFGVTAVKEGLDDYGRRQADKLANGRVYTVVRGGARQDVPSRDIRVGDILRLEENDEVPCDCVILASSDANGNAYIQTTNLDGESNLKVRTALPATKGLTTEEAVGAFKGTVQCAAPNEHIYVFDSQLRVEGDGDGNVLPLSASQLLLQATHLRNTDWMFGLVVYTGNETKFGKNKKTPPTKYTLTDGFINNVSASIFAFQLVLVFIFGIVGDTFTDSKTRNWSYMLYAGVPYPAYNQLIIPARFLLLNSTMIPISLKLTIDLCKLYYAKFIDNDMKLYDEESDTPAHSNSTALSEDLGQVKYVLTDKTGTLTENKMVLKFAVVGGVAYGTFGGPPSKAADAAADPEAEAEAAASAAAAAALLPPSLASAAKDGILADLGLYRAAQSGKQDTLEFFRCLALNNDVVPAPDSGNPTRRHYKASSPDEEALVKSAAAYDVALWERVGEGVTITVHGERETYVQLVAFEFTSDRKRMSVLLRLPSGRLRLYIKGADDMIMARLAPGQDAAKAALQDKVNAYATAGLRTLIYGFRDITDAEYAEWRARYDEAAAAMVGRDEAKEKTYALMEVDIRILGATAIEDKLQDGVPETIALLKKAGISFWMLTGDKFSTAKTIAETSALKPLDTELVELEGDDEAEVVASVDRVYARLRKAGHDLRYEPAPTTLAVLKSVVTGTYKPHTPPRPFTATAAAGGVAAFSTPGGGEPVVNPMRAASVDDVVVVDGGEEEDSKKSSSSAGRKRPYTIIVRGASLEIALRVCRERFAAVCCGADSVICCRVTPKQKGQLVRVVRDAGHLTLAIGDGGNDVAMIQEASVGIGIRGKEGLQAARASDYQVTYFRALQRLLLVHGRYSYYRTALVAQYSFYKSFLFCIMQIGYGFFSGYAGVSLFNSLCVAAYNAVLFVPIVFFLVDRDVTQRTALTQPQAYMMCSEGELLTARTMFVWMLRGLWQAVVVLLFGIYANSVSRSSDYESLGLLIFMAYMFTQDFTMLFALRRVTWYNTLSIFGMHVFSFGVGLVTNIAWGMRSFIDYGSFNNTLKDPSFWLTCLLTTVVVVLPVQAIEWWSYTFNDSFANRLAYVDRR